MIVLFAYKVLGAGALFLCAAICSALVSIFSDDRKLASSIFRRLPPGYFLRSMSRDNVYARYPTGALKVKYFTKLNREVYVERFRGSSTIFSFFMDAYSLFSVLRDALAVSAISWAAGLVGLEFWVYSAALFVVARFLSSGLVDLFSITSKK
jgi:hypothetical protein